MSNRRAVLLAIPLLAIAAAGCSNERPRDAARKRPPVDALVDRDRGIESKELVESTDLMVADLMRLPALNDSRVQWTIVTTPPENQTSTTSRQDYRIFVDTLKTKIFRASQGRITIIENRDAFRDVQSKELEGPGADPFGQGGGPVAPGPAGTQPDFRLSAKIQDLPNRTTTTYRFEFNLVGLKGQYARQMVWTGDYIVKTGR